MSASCRHCGAVVAMEPRELDHLRRCAENEGGRAVLAVRGYADADTAYYFAREAARYGALVVEALDESGFVLCEKCDALPRCFMCGDLVDAEEATPYCGPECAARAAAESED